MPIIADTKGKADLPISQLYFSTSTSAGNPLTLRGNVTTLQGNGP
jgi:hypothetical protein